jgi:biotin synthase
VIPKLVRLSIGSATELGLERFRLDTKPTTIYILLYNPHRCKANCAFCSQAKESLSDLDKLSRVEWPLYDLHTVSKALQNVKSIKRICIQTLNHSYMFRDLTETIKIIKKKTELPISVSCKPLEKNQLKMLRKLGVDRISIPLDAATEGLFEKVKGEKVKGPYSWKRHIKALKEAVKIFGNGKISTHLIIGLGEKEEQAASFMQRMKDEGIYTGLFAFTPIVGTLLENNQRPNIESYRRIQIARHLISTGLCNYNKMKFDRTGKITNFGIDIKTLTTVIGSGNPFCTSGCPGCNRPYYNERPSGPIYNFPHQPNKKDIEVIRNQLK